MLLPEPRLLSVFRFSVTTGKWTSTLKRHDDVRITCLLLLHAFYQTYLIPRTSFLLLHRGSNSKQGK